ncbi:MAG: hypothetical protein ACPG7F_04565 [Aggregatilineales bacterium]
MNKQKRKRGNRSRFNIRGIIDDMLATCAVCVWALMFYLLAYIPGQLPVFTPDFVIAEKNDETQLHATGEVLLLSSAQQGLANGAGSHFMSLLAVGMVLILVQSITRLMPAPMMQHSRYFPYWNTANRFRYVPP